MPNPPDPPRTSSTCSLCGYDVGADREGEAAAHALDPDEPGRYCDECLALARMRTLQQRLDAERGELKRLEVEVARRADEAAEDALAALRLKKEKDSATLGQRVADEVARVGGSWRFVIGAVLVIAAWMGVNAALGHAFDPYPFILLNLMLSCVAALQAPIIMMSQNRAAAHDRAQAERDFHVNVKAEKEVAGLNAKLDHLLHSRWENLLLMQQIQLDLMRRIAARGASATSRPRA
jgi:uncharacterized membrane protein